MMYAMAGRSSSGGEAATWNTVNLGDGSWSAASDPASMISSASTTAGLTTWNYNTVNPGSNANAPGSADATFNCWRVYKALTADGVTLTGADSFEISFEIDCSTGFSGDDNTEIFIGLAKDPTSTTRSSVQHAGVIERHIAASTDPDFAACNHTGVATQIGNAGITKALCYIGVHEGVLSEVGAIADGVSTVSSRPASITFSGAETFYLMVAVGTRVNGTITSGSSAAATLRYTLSKLS